METGRRTLKIYSRQGFPVLMLKDKNKFSKRMITVHSKNKIYGNHTQRKIFPKLHER